LAFVRFTESAVIVVLAGIVLVSILSPRIPPFVGYFLCQLPSFKDDPCGMKGFDRIGLISWTSVDISTMVFRIVSGCICMLVYIPGLWSTHQLTILEVLPNLLFQSESLTRLKENAKNSRRALSDTNRLLRKYRQLQVINNVFNEIFRTDFFAIVMVGVALTMVLTGSFLLTSYHHVHQLVLIILAFTTFIEYCVIITIFIFASNVWTESDRFQWAWRKNDTFSKSRVAKKVGKSLRSLKIEIGSRNFVERNTPFVYLSFCIEQTISLVLLSKS
jgi:hypothetical protein